MRGAKVGSAKVGSAKVGSVLAALQFLIVVGFGGPDALAAEKSSASAALSSAEMVEAGDRLLDLAKNSKDVAIAMRLLGAAARKGDTDAAYLLGSIFLTGKHGVDADPELARRHLDTAIAAGNAKAAYQLGRAMVRGNGVAKDVRSGIRLLSRKIVTASEEAPKASYELGRLYLTGDEGVAPDPVKARRHLERAAEGGIIDAKLRLARALISGEGLPPDPDAGVALLEEARAAGGEAAIAAAAELGATFLAGAEGLPPDPLRARRYLDEAAAAGDGDAALRLARALIGGKGLPAEPVAGLAILTKLAAAEGDAGVSANADLGEIYLHGAGGIVPDPVKARTYLQAAAGQGDDGAAYRLGTALLTGDGLPASPGAGAIILDELAAEEGRFAARAHYALGLHYLESAPDPAKAREHLASAAAGGHVRAAMRLGRALIKGETVEPDVVAGVALLEPIAATDGADAAWSSLELGRFYLAGGAGIKASPAKARSYLEKAAAGGQADAYTTLARASLAGDLGPKDGKAALTYFEAAAKAGAHGVDFEIARVHLLGAPGVKQDIGRGLELMKESANKGSVAALRELIRVHRGDRGPPFKQDLSQAASYLDEFRRVGEAEDILFEEVLLAIAGRPGLLSENAAEFERLPVPLQGAAIRRVLSLDKKLAVYFTQIRLKAAGLYVSALDGVAGGGTIAAIHAACRSAQSQQCGPAPLHQRTLDFVLTSVGRSH